MTDERYARLMQSDDPLTAQEVFDGWHFCREFDELLVGPGMSELRRCSCLPKEHPVYSTAPPDEGPVDLEGQL
jgi:hypothetical protein